MRRGAILVPQRAVNELQGNYQVAVVGPDNKVEIRAVEAAERIGSLWVVTKGLRAGRPHRRRGHPEGEGGRGVVRSRRARAGGRLPPAPPGAPAGAK